MGPLVDARVPAGDAVGPEAVGPVPADAVAVLAEHVTAGASMDEEEDQEEVDGNQGQLVAVPPQRQELVRLFLTQQMQIMNNQQIQLHLQQHQLDAMHNGYMTAAMMARFDAEQRRLDEQAAREQRERHHSETLQQRKAHSRRIVFLGVIFAAGGVVAAVAMCKALAVSKAWVAGENVKYQATLKQVAQLKRQSAQQATQKKAMAAQQKQLNLKYQATVKQMEQLKRQGAQQAAQAKMTALKQEQQILKNKEQMLQLKKANLKTAQQLTKVKITADQSWSTPRAVHAVTHFFGQVFGRGAASGAGKTAAGHRAAGATTQAAAGLSG